ncbi:MAG: Hpt domain-containing protein [Deltaproteobacteria bacterium]|nr:Hpt domain-containing protein [Deltaproteobacteria bacterium]
MDIQVLAENLEMEPEEIVGLVKLFHETSVANLEILLAALAQGNLREVAEAAHRIRNGAIDLGLQGTHKAAKEVEMQANQNTLKGVEKSVTTLQEKLARLAESLQNKSFHIL